MSLDVGRSTLLPQQQEDPLEISIPGVGGVPDCKKLINLDSEDRNEAHDQPADHDTKTWWGRNG